ncbi:MAG: PTS system mannose/fructose/sorbose family transporter subunit IID [Deltaproteobacteria bacterium]|nr:PTS system mannose/fructose/sorbose family transporter subunit IID [Deltaproteobacteria bacterium]
MGGLTHSVRRKVWWRLFLLQGCWNYEGMQNVGFAYGILPALRHYYRERPEDLIKSLKRNLEYFNTHPAMGGVILGATARIEERVASGEADPRAIGTFKVALMGSLGAIGDSYFWGALKPMASVAGAILSLIHPALGIAALLLLYNLSHVLVRLKGFAAGMDGEESAVRFLKEAGFTGRTEDRKILAAILGGAYAGVLSSKTAFMSGEGPSAVGFFIVALLAVHIVTVLFRKAVSPSEIMLFLLVIGTIFIWR